MIQKKRRIGHQKVAATVEPLDLPPPALGSRRLVAQALRLRRTIREISDKKLPLQVLSDLLWAACGVNRKKGPFGVPGRTAASASNCQEIDVYVALKEATYLYLPLDHCLLPIIAGDLRPLAIGRGQGHAGAGAPARLIYVVDIAKLEHTGGFEEPGLHDPAVQKSYYYVDTGLIAANVYLFAASTGLASWFHNCDRIGLAARLGLRRDQRVLFGQTVGYPNKKGRRASP